MDTRSVALIGLYVVVAFFVYVWLAIPPGTGWDGKIHWGDVATWVSAIGTIAAVVVALGIAIRDGRQREMDRYARGRVIAAYLFADVGVAQRALEEAERQLEKGLAVGTQAEYNLRISRAYRALRAIDLSKIISNMDKVAELPARHAVGLSALADNIRVLSSALADQIAKGSEVSLRSLQDTSTMCMEQVFLSKAKVDAFMAEFEPEFVG